MSWSAAATRGASDDAIDKAIAHIVEELKLENKTGNLEVFETLMYIKREESPPDCLRSYLTQAHQRILDAMPRATPKKEETANTKQKWKKLPKKEEDLHIVTPRTEGEGSAPGPVTRLSGAQHDTPFLFLSPPTAEVGVNVTPLDFLSSRRRGLGYPVYTFPPTILFGDPPGDNPHRTRLSDRQWREMNRLPTQPRAPRRSAAASSAEAASSANFTRFQ